MGSKDLKLALLLPMGIGTAVGTLLVNFVLKKFKDKGIMYTNTQKEQEREFAV